jgi:hypothetical protein
MDHGWVYVLVNSSMPGLAKVGRTFRPPAERAAELSGVTSVPTPFVLVFDQPFADCCAAERAIHDELDRRGLRTAANREFFRGPVADIIRIVQSVEANGPPTQAPVTRTAASWLAEGDRHLLGLGDALQDTGEAARCYKLASSQGSLLAFERLGRIYMQLYAARPGRANRRRALAPLKEGARRGNYYCYCEMAQLFACDRHISNFIKSWALFFDRRSAAWLPEVEGGQPRFAAACRAYIGSCLDLGLVPAHRAEMRRAGEAILRGQMIVLEDRHMPPDARAHAVAVLGWTYRVLLRDLAAGPAAREPARIRLWSPRRETVPA